MLHRKLDTLVHLLLVFEVTANDHRHELNSCSQLTCTTTLAVEETADTEGPSKVEGARMHERRRRATGPHSAAVHHDLLS